MYIFHFISEYAIWAENINILPACLRTCPVKLPLILRPHGHPASLLHVGDDHRLVHVGAVGHLGTHADGEDIETALCILD